MSKKRLISFKDNEIELLEYFDNFGKSELVKKALRFYKENYNKFIIGDLSELVSIIKSTNNNSNVAIQESPSTSADIKIKINKLKR